MKLCEAGSKVWLSTVPGVPIPAPALMPPPARRNPVRNEKTLVKPVSTDAENARSGPRENASDPGSNRDEVFVSGTAAELTPLREIDDHAVGDGRPGEITRAVQTAYEDALHGRSERYREWLDPVPVESPAPQVA